MQTFTIRNLFQAIQHITLDFIVDYVYNGDIQYGPIFLVEPTFSDIFTHLKSTLPIERVQIYVHFHNQKTFNLPSQVATLIGEYSGINPTILVDIFNDFTPPISMDKIGPERIISNVRKILIDSEKRYCCSKIMMQRVATNKYCDDCSVHIPNGDTFLYCTVCKKDKCCNCMEYNKCSCNICKLKHNPDIYPSQVDRYNMFYCPYIMCRQCTPMSRSCNVPLTHMLPTGNKDDNITCDSTDCHYHHWWKTSIRNSEVDPHALPMSYCKSPFTEMWRSTNPEPYCKTEQNLNLDPAGYFHCSDCNKNWCTACVLSKFPLKAFQQTFWANRDKSNLFDLANAHPKLADWIEIASADPVVTELEMYLRDLAQADTVAKWKETVRLPKSLIEYTEVEKMCKCFMDNIYQNSRKMRNS